MLFRSPATRTPPAPLGAFPCTPAPRQQPGGTKPEAKLQPVNPVSGGQTAPVRRSADTASGNWSLTGTITLSGVVAEDLDGHHYAVVGSAHFGYSYNAQTGIVIAIIDGHVVSEAVTTFKWQFVSHDGGLGGSLSFLQHASPNGNYFELSPGSCTFG